MPAVPILMIDDDAELGAMLTEYLAAEGFETTVMLTGEAGVAAALGGSFAAVILDIMLPRIGGLDVLRRIRHASRVPVIMLTARGDNVDRVVGLELGADDYVAKPCYPRELVARLRAVLRRTDAASMISPSVLVLAGIRLEPDGRRVTIDGQDAELTVTEFNLLERLLRAGARVISKDELSREVLGRPHEPYDRSLDVHMSHLRRKLQDYGADDSLFETVRGIGYRVRQD